MFKPPAERYRPPPPGYHAGSQEVVLGWLAFALMLIGSVTTNVAIFQGESSVMFTSYVPMKAAPHFYLGLILFAVGALALLTIAPATLALGALAAPALQAAVASQPLALQVAEALVCADLAQYAVHRAFHAVPALWRFHAIHHSSRAMDWLAGSRLHLVDALATRAAAFAPLFWLGFSERALAAYLVVVSFQAVFLHANVRLRFGPLRWLVATPEFHHWHHAEAPLDKNFAVHVPWIDLAFGTAWLPGGFPERYGIAGDPVPESWRAQLSWPLSRSRASAPTAG